MLRISLGLNAVLLVAVLGLGALLVWRSWEATQEIDARPKGAVIALTRETRIISAEAPTVYLPAGTILQESTPQGAATLGKIYDREYILTIRTENRQFTTNYPYEKSKDWKVPYTFAASQQKK